MEERIMDIMKYSGKTVAQFAEFIGVSPSAISHIQNRRNRPSLDIVQKILEAMPEINTEWLMRGDGEMLANNFHRQKENIATNEMRLGDLFSSSQPSENAKTPSTLSNNVEHRKETPVKMSPNTLQLTEKQIVDIHLQTPRKASKIIIYYTDNTFETFVPSTDEGKKR